MSIRIPCSRLKESRPGLAESFETLGIPFAKARQLNAKTATMLTHVAILGIPAMMHSRSWIRDDLEQA